MNKIKAAVHVKAYGFVGASGIGLVYVTDPSSTVKGKKNTFSRSSSYFGLVAYSTIQYDSIFYTPKGSFQVAG